MNILSVLMCVVPLEIDTLEIYIILMAENDE